MSDLIIRADASPRVGAGHVMRCLALSHAARDAGLNVSIAGRVSVPWLRRKLKGALVQFCEVTDDIPVEESPDRLLNQIGNVKGKWVVLDGYHFGLQCQKAVRENGGHLLVIDDYAHLPEYHCDILFNQNIGAEKLEYTGFIGEKILRPGYALLRPEFAVARAMAEKRDYPAKAVNIICSLGGGDLSRYLEQISPILTIPELTGCVLRVIAGSMQPERIKAILCNCPANLEILERVDDVAELLLQSDLCISAGGSTCWELCCLGVPFLTLIMAENQRRIVLGLEDEGIAFVLSSSSLREMLLSKESRRMAGRAGMRLVDGLGAKRVIKRLVMRKG